MSPDETLGGLEAMELLGHRDKALEGLEGLLDALLRMRNKGSRKTWATTARALKEMDIQPRAGRDRILLLASDARAELDSLLEFLEGKP